MVIVRAGNDVQVEGWDDQRVLASTGHGRDLKLTRGGRSAIGHIRALAKAGNHVLFDVSADLLKRKHADVPDRAIEVQAGPNVLVRVPHGSTLEVYAGQSAEVRGVGGEVTVYAGRAVRLSNVPAPHYVSAAGAIDLDCVTLSGGTVDLSAGGDLRFHVGYLKDATIRIDDGAGQREVVLGQGRGEIRLKAGGDVVLSTDRPGP